MNEILKRQQEIIDYRPEPYSPKIMSFINKVSVENELTVFDKDGLIDVFKHNHMSVIDRLIDLELLVYAAKEDVNDANLFSDDILEVLNDIFDNDVKQLREIQDLYKLKNFGSKEIDYYKIQGKVEDMLEDLMIEHKKETNKVNYTTVNQDTKINYLINSFAAKKVKHYRKIYDVLEDNVKEEKVYKYSEDDITTLKNYEVFKEEELRLSQNKYVSLAFDKSFTNALSTLFDKRKEVAFNMKVNRDEETSIWQQSSELLKYNTTMFDLTLADFFKHIELETQQFDSFMMIFESYAKNNNELNNLTN